MTDLIIPILCVLLTGVGFLLKYILGTISKRLDVLESKLDHLTGIDSKLDRILDELKDIE